MTDLPESRNDFEQLTTLVYILQALGFFTGGLTMFAGVVVNYVRKDDVAGSWLASHFRWQIRTFWFFLLWSVIGYIAVFVVIGIPILFANLIWAIYRIVKGWLYLSENKPMYTQLAATVESQEKGVPGA